MNPFELEQALLELGREKANAKAQAFLLEQNLKRVKAEQYTLSRRTHTQGDAEHYAILSEAYQAALKKLADARERLDRAEVAYDAKKAWFEGWRTLEATKRAEIALQ